MQKCGAKTRNGKPCKKPPISGSKRCKNHGGKSSGPAPSPGSLYSQYLSADDLKNFNQSSSAIGALETEIQLARMQLARVLRIRNERDQLNDHMQIEESTDDESRVTTKKKLIQYDDLIIRYTGRIESLETKRMAMISQDLDAQLKRKELTADIDDELPESKRIVFEAVDGRNNCHN